MLDVAECCSILGVKPPTSEDAIKVAHRDLVNVWHPDRFAHDPRLQAKAEEHTKRINAAYTTLREALRGGSGGPTTNASTEDHPPHSPPFDAHEKPPPSPPVTRTFMQSVWKSLPSIYTAVGLVCWRVGGVEGFVAYLVCSILLVATYFGGRWLLAHLRGPTSIVHWLICGALLLSIMPLGILMGIWITIRTFGR